MVDWSAVLSSWRDVVGSDHVSDDPGELKAAGTATFATSGKIPAIVRPGAREEVQGCLRVASQHRAPVYVVSGGKNWGLGSRAPTSETAALLDLGRLKAISGYDEALAHVTVEPGVTFAELYDFLKARRSRLFANTTGASPHASVVGNALERGDGAGPRGDRWGHVCALEVVLPTGECIHTGYGRFGDTPLVPLHRWGVGPELSGLFSQSNLGVVTRMTLWLTPLPKALVAIRFQLMDPERLGGAVDALRTLKLDGTIRSVVGIWNDYRVLSTRGRFPWALTEGRTPLTRAHVDRLKHEWGGATWFGLTAIYAASASQAGAHREHVQRVLGPTVDRLTFSERVGEPHSGGELFDDEDPGLAFLQGIPHEKSLASVYWRKHTAPPSDPDPDRDGCGVVWACPAVPLDGADVGRAVAIAEDEIPLHGLEPLIAMVSQTERTMYVVPLLIYDRETPGADESAMDCHDALMKRFVDAGYLPHRLGVHSMRSVPPAADDYATVLRRLKDAMDPSGVLAPGRYDPR